MATRNDTPGQPLPKTPKPTCKIKQIKVHAIPDRDKLVPWLRVQGQWLQQAGFEIDTPVHVHVMHGCLIFKTNL